MRRFNQMKQHGHLSSWEDFDELDYETYYDMVQVGIVNDYCNRMCDYKRSVA